MNVLLEVDSALSSIHGATDRLRKAYDEKDIHSWKYADELHYIYSAILRARSALSTIIDEPRPKTFIQDWTKLCDNALRFAQRSRLQLEQIKEFVTVPEARTPTNATEDFINATINTLEELKSDLSHPEESS